MKVRCQTPRLLYAMKDNNIDITGSYTVTDLMTWTPLMEKIKEKVIKETGHNIKYAQLNYYRDGRDYIGFHSDREMCEGDIIASISLGVTRRFILRHIDYKNSIYKKHQFELEDGSLIIMDYNSGKKYWKNSLPKMHVLRDGEERINITFRPCQ